MNDIIPAPTIYYVPLTLEEMLVVAEVIQQDVVDDEDDQDILDGAFDKLDAILTENHSDVWGDDE